MRRNDSQFAWHDCKSISFYEGEDIDEDADMAALGDRLLKQEGLPDFEPVNLTLEDLVKEGTRLAEQQQYVNDHKLSVDYMKDLGKSKSGGLIGLKG